MRIILMIVEKGHWSELVGQIFKLKTKPHQMMYKSKGKIEKDSHVPVAVGNGNKQPAKEALFQFADHRQEAKTQQSLQNSITAGTRNQQHKALQATIRPIPLSNSAAQLQSAGPINARNPVRKKANQTGLPDTLKAGIENLSGQSLEDVKVHYNSAKPAQLQAHAYAQGTEIHLGPGQEKHLPHEAWHVVQQKQGRVKPTLQMKGAVKVNDDPKLEKEADRMGARSLTQKQPVNPILKPVPGTRVVQAYSIKREPKLGTLYSVSDDTRMVTGMGTPNHDLFVDRTTMIGEIKVAAKQSMLSFAQGPVVKMFGKNYAKVQTGFKKVKFTAPAEVQNPSLLERIQGKGSPKEHKVDLDKEYQTKVAPAIFKQSLAKYNEALNKIGQKPWKESFGEIKAVLNRMVNELDLFKKLVIANQTTDDYHDLENDMEAPHKIVAILEQLIYSNDSSREKVLEAKDELFRNAAKTERSAGKDEHLKESLADLMNVTGQLAQVMPKRMPVDLMLVHSVNYQASMMKSIKDKDPMFYRACDVMATTVLGNKMTHENKDQLKIYRAGGNSGAMHYAAKVLKSGADWVTLESFAAGAREREVLGITHQNAGKNLDNSWQYMMYGAIRKRGGKGNVEDNAFELYTKLRYYLKGIKEPGEFRTDPRDKLTGDIPKNAFITIPGINALKSEALWKRFHASGIFNAEGKVEKAEYLQADYISLRLDMPDRQYAAQISQRLIQLYHTPRSQQRYIQFADQNHMKNIAGWIQLLGLPDDHVQMGVDSNNANVGGVNPLQSHNEAWIKLMLSMKKNL